MANCRDGLCGAEDCGTCFPGSDEQVRCADCCKTISRGALYLWTAHAGAHYCGECAADLIRQNATELKALIEEYGGSAFDALYAELKKTVGE